MNHTESTPCPGLPTPMRRLGPLFPLPVAAPVIERLLQQVFGDAVRSGTLELLEGREMAIVVEDLDLRLGFSLEQGRLRATRGRRADALIRGRLAAFLWLAAERADPDTLFFNRQLLMEGDTELGLAIKNLLDATGGDTLPQPLRQAIAWLADRVPAQPPGSEDIPG